jgi:glycosyltransferase involved in cell wall biosynthesis
MEIEKVDELELSVVVLCYRAEDYTDTFCRQLLKELKPTTDSFEIILVANFDSDYDSTPETCRKLAKEFEQVRYVSIPKSGKMGWDMRMGLEMASGRYLSVIDGDGQMPSSDIAVVFNIITNNPFDLVKTYRTTRADGAYRRILSYGYNVLFNALYCKGISLKDVNSKPKIFTREAYQQLSLRSNDWFTDAEIMIQAIDLELRICEVGTVFRKNDRRSTYVNFSTIIEFIINLVQYRFVN